MEFNPALVRVGFFAGLFALFALAEARWPRRARALSRADRWTANLCLVAIDALTLRILLPLSLIEFAAWHQTHGYGLLSAFALPLWLEVALAIALLDLAIYLQHRLFHRVPALWRLHRVHHTDLDFDVTTGARFHPIEVLISAAFKTAVIAALGASPLSVLIFEILLNGTATFNHANLRLPAGVDRVLRRFVVTPDMHRVHHSWLGPEQNSNFGFNAPWWDWLFGTYRAQPEAGHETMTIGTHTFRERRDQLIDRLLLQPFRPL